MNFFQSHKDNFFDVLFESLVASELTMEHQYVSLLFSIDGLQHPLLDGLVLQRGADGDYLVTKPDLEPLRLTVVTRAWRSLHKRNMNLFKHSRGYPESFCAHSTGG